jgi:hypothetical protein
MHTQRKEDSDILEHYMKTEMFTKLADFVNPHLETDDFGDHFVELYDNRFKNVQGSLHSHLKVNIASGKFDKEVEDALDRSVLNLKFNMKSEKILGKLRLYTLAHVSKMQL